MIAALFVQTDGHYFDVPGIDPWDAERDATLYRGPHPVIAHPPCARWGRYWWRGANGVRYPRPGVDGGLFGFALNAVRDFGGVLEHPRDSLAWDAFALNKPPVGGGWVPADDFGMTCCVYQGHYGHLAPKATWLYAVDVDFRIPIQWGAAPTSKPPQSEESIRRRGARSANDAIERMSANQRLATPIPFRDLLIKLARSVR